MYVLTTCMCPVLEAFRMDKNVWFTEWFRLDRKKSDPVNDADMPSLSETIQRQRSPLVPALNDFWTKWQRPEKQTESTMPDQNIDELPVHGPQRLTFAPFQQRTSVILDTGSSNLIIPSTFNEPLRAMEANFLHTRLCDDVLINCDGSASVSFRKLSGWSVDSPAFATRIYQLRTSKWKFQGIFNGDSDDFPLQYDIVLENKDAIRQFVLNHHNEQTNTAGLSMPPLHWHPPAFEPSGKCHICVVKGKKSPVKTNSFKEKVAAAAAFSRSQNRPLDTNHFADKNGKGVETVRSA
jgi:hypothetical protein